jgi:hypothetical protein
VTVREEVRAPRALLASSFAVAAVLRLVHAAVTDPVMTSRGDNTFFAAVARSVATGHGGRLPTMAGTDAISVKFPPLWPWVLGAGQRILWFVSPATANTVWSATIGATVAPLAGLLAWRLLDHVPRARRTWLAAGVALLGAAHPLLLGAASSLMSEVLVVPMALGVLLVLDRVARRGATGLCLVGLGALVGFSALLRVESIVLWGAAILVAAWLARSWRLLVVPLAVAAVPVLAYSAVATHSAGTTVLISTNTASAIAGANCDAAWSGEGIGHWSKDCLDQVWLGRVPPDQRRTIYAYERLPNDRFPAQLGPKLEGEIQAAQRRGAGYAVRRHPGLVVRAMPVRVARGLGLWWSADQTRLEVAEGRVVGWEEAGRWVHLLLVLPFAAVTAVALARRRSALAVRLRRCVDPQRLLPWAATTGVWVLGLAATHGSTRHRAGVDAIFLVAAAIGLAVVMASEDPSGRDARAREAACNGSDVIDLSDRPVAATRTEPVVAHGLKVGRVKDVR